MDELIRKSLLYDFYGELLTEHQQRIYQSFCFDDLSLSEIAEQEQTSRQAVHDIVKRCDKALAEYEEKLHLVDRFASLKSGLEQIRDMSTRDPEIHRVAESLLKEL